MRQEDIVGHVYEFYMGLMGTSKPNQLGLQPTLW